MLLLIFIYLRYFYLFLGVDTSLLLLAIFIFSVLPIHLNPSKLNMYSFNTVLESL